jgi:hypothetical protein
MLALVLSSILALPATKNGDGTCGLWKEKYVAAGRLQSNATGPTPTTYGGGAIAGMLLDATTEHVFFMVHIDSTDYDSTSDTVIKVNQLLDGAESENDKIDGEILCSYGSSTVIWSSPKNQTRTVAHDIAANFAAGTNHEVVYVFNRALADNNIVAGDRMYCRYRLTDVGAGHVAAVVVLEIAIYYRTCYPAEPLVTFPSEG